MTFNLFVVLAAVVTGGLSSAAGLASKRRGSMAVLLSAAAVGMIGSIAAVLVSAIGIGLDFFGIIHVAYAILTIGVPLTCLVLLSARHLMPRVVQAGLVVGLLAVPVGLYASYVEPFWLRTDRVELNDPRAPVDGAGSLRIGVLADLQTIEVGDYENRAVDALLAEEPDLVVIPGDLWQMSAEEFEERWPQFAELLMRLDAAVPHVVAVNGNSDTVGGLRRLVEGTGVVVLDNEIVDLDVNGNRVRIGGITLFGNEDLVVRMFEELYAGEEPDIFRLLLAHQPDEVRRLTPDDPIDLFVAGHTHGGQVQLPFVGPLVTLSVVPRSVAAGGLHVLDSHWTYVSTGVGRERERAPQMRFGVRPSIGIIDVLRS